MMSMKQKADSRSVFRGTRSDLAAKYGEVAHATQRPPSAARRTRERRAIGTKSGGQRRKPSDAAGVRPVGCKHKSGPLPSLLLQGFAQPVEVSLVVFLAKKAGFAVVSALNDLQGYAMKVNSGEAVHKRTLAEIF
jgi:hypothetical protein